MRFWFLGLSFTLCTFGSERSIELRALPYLGNIFWTPADHVVFEGDQVNIKLINNRESTNLNSHQFEIVGLVEPFQISAGEIKYINFHAKNPGVYRIKNENSTTEGRLIILRK